MDKAINPANGPNPKSFTAKIAKIRPRIKIFEVGISYYGRTYEEGKKIGPKDGIKAIYCIIKYNLFSTYHLYQPIF